MTTPAAKERDYIRAIVEASGDEMKPLCHLLRGAAEVVGFGELAERYLDGARFREMLLRRDEEKLERLNAIVQDQAQAVPVKVLMDVAAELDGRAGNYDGMDAASKRKASREMKKLIGKVEEMRSAIDANAAEIERKIDDHDANTKKRFDDVRDELHETKEELMAKVDAILKKVGKVNFGGKRKCRHTAEQKRVCLALWMEPDFTCEFGKNITIGSDVYINFGCTLLDCGQITIGDHTLLGPHVSMYSANHSLDAAERIAGALIPEPITVGSRVWIGGGSTILSGVTIGDDAVIGAGSVVTRDIPPGVVAAGNPCRVLRKITEEDKVVFPVREDFSGDQEKTGEKARS